jgi:hypothetical protein
MCEEDLVDMNEPEIVTVSGAPCGMKMASEDYDESSLIYR